MRYMRWSCQDYMNAPVGIIHRIGEIAQKEAERQAQQARKNKLKR